MSLKKSVEKALDTVNEKIEELTKEEFETKLIKHLSVREF